MSSIVAESVNGMFASPFDILAYRALVFVRCNRDFPLYSVAGVAGGPWKSETALSKSHIQHGGPCYYCGKGISKGQATIDHVEPTALGGNGAIQNLVIACKPCNAAKGHKVLDFHDPKSGQKWLEALRLQIDQRLAAINPPSSPPPPSRAAAGGP